MPLQPVQKRLREKHPRAPNSKWAPTTHADQGRYIRNDKKKACWREKQLLDSTSSATELKPRRNNLQDMLLSQSTKWEYRPHENKSLENHHDNRIEKTLTPSHPGDRTDPHSTDL